jgi:folate receptor
MLAYFPGSSSSIRDVPLCSSTCDNWFEACMNDIICTGDWLEEFLVALEEGSNSCSGRECLTFAEVFRDGRGLCNRIWGNAYFYAEDEDNCTVLFFDRDMGNPNSQLSFPVDSAASGGVTNSIILIIVGLLLSF